jgi:hypothetical protein
MKLYGVEGLYFKLLADETTGGDLVSEAVSNFVGFLVIVENEQQVSTINLSKFQEDTFIFNGVTIRAIQLTGGINGTEKARTENIGEG